MTNDGRWGALFGIALLVAAGTRRAKGSSIRTDLKARPYLHSPSSPKNATPLTDAQWNDAWNAGYEAASKRSGRNPTDRDTLFLDGSSRDGRIPRPLTEGHPSFWEYEEAFAQGASGYYSDYKLDDEND